MIHVCPHCAEPCEPEQMTRNYWCCPVCRTCSSKGGWEMLKSEGGITKMTLHNKAKCPNCWYIPDHGEVFSVKDQCLLCPMCETWNPLKSWQRLEVFVDPVHQPAHYQQFPKETIDIIHNTLGDDAFCAYCTGNELKYRLRAGDKGDAAQDMDKAMQYRRFRLNVQAGRGPREDA